MSVDMVDDLHAAEDRIGQLEAAVLAVEDALLTGDMSKVIDLLGDAVAVVRSGFCRPSCDEGCDDDCGCACHNDATESTCAIDECVLPADHSGGCVLRDVRVDDQ